MATDPTQIDIGQILAQIEKLPQGKQKQLVKTLTEKLQTSPAADNPAEPLKAGWAKGLITIGPDFDEPLEDFKEYME